MEPPSRLASPWAHDNSPLPSPGPPPSPAVWIPHEWTPGPRRDLTPSRSLPLIPSSHPLGAARTNTTLAPLPTHPEFLSNLYSHPLIFQHGDARDSDSDSDDTRTPSPASSLELVLHPFPAGKPNPKPDRSNKPEGQGVAKAAAAHVYSSSPVPFPVSSSSGFTSPVLCGSPRPLPSVDGSHKGVVSVPSSVESSPGRAPDLMGSPFPTPPRNRPLPKAQAQAPPAPPSSQLQAQAYASAPAQPQFQHPPPPPPLPQAQTRAEPKLPPLAEPKLQSRNQSAAPRPRLPAMRGSREFVNAVPRPQSHDLKHPLFYMREGMIVLKVEGALYRVHRYLLEQHSEFLRTALDDDDAMGHTDDRPISLPDNITQNAFDCLLSFLYHGIYDPASVPPADWVTLLRAASRLQFAKVRAYAIRELTARRAALALGAVDALLLAREHDVPAWLGPAYAELVRRPAALTDDEAERLGARTTAQVARAREMLRAEEFAAHQLRRYGAQYVAAEQPDEQLVARAVNEVFGLAQGAGVSGAR